MSIILNWLFNMCTNHFRIFSATHWQIFSATLWWIFSVTLWWIFSASPSCGGPQQTQKAVPGLPQDPAVASYPGLVQAVAGKDDLASPEEQASHLEARRGFNLSAETVSSRPPISAWRTSSFSQPLCKCQFAENPRLVPRKTGGSKNLSCYREWKNI
jgi:hypothetical protein